MASAFPNALDSFTLNVDGVDDVLAADMNLVQDAALALETYLLSSHIGENLLYHSMTHNIWPGGITFADLADDSYVAGVWNIVSSANTPDISAIDGVSTEPMSKYFRCIMDAASQQCGLLQFLSYEDTAKLRGQTLSLGFDAWGTNITAIRAAVLYSTDTPDTFVSDVVGTWATGNQTLVTNWFYANTPAADITISGTRARKEVEGISIPTTANNIAVFIWTPNPEASGDLFNITRVKLEIGDVCTPFSTPGYEAELARVQQFVVAFKDIFKTGFSFRVSSNQIMAMVAFPGTMISAPAIVNASDLNTTLGTGAKQVSFFDLVALASTTNTGNVTVANNSMGRTGGTITFTAATSFSGTGGSALNHNHVADDLNILFSSRL